MVGRNALGLEQDHLLEAIEEIVLFGAGVLAAAQRERGDLVGAGRAGRGPDRCGRETAPPAP